jgi:hypothetical protein
MGQWRDGAAGQTRVWGTRLALLFGLGWLASHLVLHQTSEGDATIFGRYSTEYFVFMVFGVAASVAGAVLTLRPWLRRLVLADRFRLKMAALAAWIPVGLAIYVLSYTLAPNIATWNAAFGGLFWSITLAMLLATLDALWDVGQQPKSAQATAPETLRLTRHDALAFVLLGLAIVLMTYPVAFRLGDGLPSNNPDLFSALWQSWWLREVVTHGHNPTYTTYLFYPNGLDLTFQPRRWTALGTWLPLSLLMGDIAAYNLNVLLGLLLSAYATYLLIYNLMGNRIAAWMGGAFYAFYPQHLVDAFGQPNTGSIQWIPVFMLCLLVGLRSAVGRSGQSERPITRGLALMLAAGVALSLNAYVNLKVGALAALSGGLYVALSALAEGWWREASFWRALGVLTACSLLLTLPLALPYLRPGAELGWAIEQFEPWYGADLLAFVKPAPDWPPFVPQGMAALLGLPDSGWQTGSFYLGLTSIALVVVGLTDFAKRDRQRVVWLLIALIFWSLSLGVILRVNTVEMAEVWMPYRLVRRNLLFWALRVPHRFTLVFTLPWAVLVGYGTARLWGWLEGRRRLAVVLIVCLGGLMLYELSQIPIGIKPLNVSSFYQTLRIDDEPDAIIDLPMGRGDSKRYMYLQTIHRRPIVQGMSARMPEGAYDYINANPLLSDWKAFQPPACDYDIRQAIGDLQADGFRYVILHYGDAIWSYAPWWQRPAMRDSLLAYFTAVEPVYRDEIIVVYDLSDLATTPPSCQSETEKQEFP